MNEMIPFPETSTELAKKVTDNVIKHYEEFGQKGLGGFVYGKFVKGTWEIGASGEAPASDERFAVNPLSIQKGAICWKEGRPADEVMYAISDGEEIDLASLPDHGPYKKDGDGWSEQAAVGVRSLTTGTDIVLKGSSRGFLQMIYKMSGAFASQVKTEGIKGDVIPIVMLTGEDYKHADYGKVFVPLMDIVAWGNDKALQAGTYDQS